MTLVLALNEQSIGSNDWQALAGRAQSDVRRILTPAHNAKSSNNAVYFASPPVF